MKRVKMLSDSDRIASGDQYYDHRDFAWKPIDSYTIGTPKIKWFQFYVVVRG
jgi:hypothetical protein